jgi:adenylylsulfate kinase-like enzyme
LVKVDLEEARRRDPKGLYAKVDNGEIRGFTGVDAPYEAPERPEVIIDSGKVSVDEAVEMLMEVVG